jgi:hypothetical protein
MWPALFVFTETDCLELQRQIKLLFGHWRHTKTKRPNFGTRKLHRLFHMLHAIKEFGCLDITCSGRWEHFHKFAAKLQYQRTSKRKCEYTKEMHGVHVFLRHLEQLTSHHVKDHRPWFVATQTKKQETERLQVPLPPCGWRVSMHRGLKGLFGVNTTTWKGLSDCHLSDADLKAVGTLVFLSSAAYLLFALVFTYSVSHLVPAQSRMCCNIRVRRSPNLVLSRHPVALRVVHRGNGERKFQTTSHSMLSWKALV